MASTSQQKVLRIGIIEDGKIVQERLIKAGETVTVGESAKNTFVFPKTGLPRAEYPLFVQAGGTYVLNFTESMKGKISSGGAVVGLEKLRTDPSVKQQGGSWRLPLTEHDRGKITIDRVTVLFQFVAPPPPEAIKPLKAMDFRPRLMDDDDPVFLGFLAIFSALAAVMVVWMVNVELPEVRGLDEIPDRFTKMLAPPPDAPPPPLEDLNTDQIDENAKGPEKDKPEEAAKPKEAPKNKVEAAQQREALKEDITQKSVLLKMLVTRGNSSSGSLAEDLFAGDGEAGNLEAALANANGGVAIASAETISRQGKGGSTTDATVADVGGIGGGNDAKLTETPKTKIEGTTEMGEGDGDLEGGDMGSVKHVVQRNFGQLTYCYEQVLRSAPNTSGRVEIEWYVTKGRVTSAEVFANTTGSAELGKCIKGKIERWSFPLEVQGEMVYPFIFRPKS